MSYQITWRELSKENWQTEQHFCISSPSYYAAHYVALALAESRGSDSVKMRNPDNSVIDYVGKGE